MGKGKKVRGAILKSDNGKRGIGRRPFDSTSPRQIHSPEPENGNAQLLFRNAAVEAACDGLVITDARQRSNPIIHVSKSFLALTGYSRQEVLGQSCSILQGTKTAPNVIQKMREAIRSGGRFRGDVLNYRKDGAPFWNYLRIEPIRESSGTLTHFVGIQTDITERKSGLDSDQTTERNERLDTLDDVAASIAHEINNPLTAAWTAAQTALSIRSRENSASFLEECLKTIVDSVQRCDRIVKNVLLLTRHRPWIKSFDDINMVVSQASKAAEMHAKRKHVTLRLELARNLGRVAISAVAIEQAMINLLNNAIDASLAYSTVTVRTNQGKNVVRISVHDHRQGFEGRQQRIILTQFHSAQLQSKIQGLGLQIVHEIIEDHAGTIEFVSAPSRGSVFTINLPISPGRSLQ
jgi:PAS domain S-box-containing protein